MKLSNAYKGEEVNDIQKNLMKMVSLWTVHKLCAEF